MEHELTSLRQDGGGVSGDFQPVLRDRLVFDKKIAKLKKEQIPFYCALFDADCLGKRRETESEKRERAAKAAEYLLGEEKGVFFAYQLDSEIFALLSREDVELDRRSAYEILDRIGRRQEAMIREGRPPFFAMGFGCVEHRAQGSRDEDFRLQIKRQLEENKRKLIEKMAGF